MNAMDRLNAALAKPMTHAVITRFADGFEKRHETRCERSAENFAIGERRKVGTALVRRDPVTLAADGPAVLVESVSIVAL